MVSQPTYHIHPEKIYETLTSLDNKSKCAFLIRTTLKKLDPSKVHSVTFSKRYGPGGPHAFFSFAPGFHPVESELKEYLRKHPNAPPAEWEDQITWVRKDGTRYEELNGATQSIELNAMCEKVWNFALAYVYYSNKDKEKSQQYASYVYDQLWSFFGDARTRMDPVVKYGQYIRGKQPNNKIERPEGLLHIRRLIGVSQILPLLPSPGNPHSPHHFMLPWLDAHVTFLQQDRVGKRAQSRKNNIFSHYMTQLTTHLITLGRHAEAYNLIHNVFYSDILTTKISSEGVPYAEVTRATPFHYVAFEIEPLSFLADLVESLKKYSDSSYQSVWPAHGHRLRKCCLFAIRYGSRPLMTGPKPPLPPDVPKEPEAKTDLRNLCFQFLEASHFYTDERQAGKPFYPFIGPGGLPGMENPTMDFLSGWNIASRLSWALIDGY